MHQQRSCIYLFILSRYHFLILSGINLTNVAEMYTTCRGCMDEENTGFQHQAIKKGGFYSLFGFPPEKLNVIFVGSSWPSQQLFKNKARLTAAEIGGLTSTSWALPPTRDFLCAPAIQTSPLNKNVSAQSKNWGLQCVKSEVGGASTTISQKGFCLLEVQSPAEFWKAVRSWAAARKGSTKSSVGPRGPVTPPPWPFHLGRHRPISHSRDQSIVFSIFYNDNHTMGLIEKSPQPKE